MPLTDTALKQVKPTIKTQRFFDGGGLYLEVTPKGAKYWRLKYRFAGKENRISFGVYPAVSLKVARAMADATKKLLDAGTDPSHNRKVTKATAKVAAANTFEAIAREWHGIKSSGWSAIHSTTVMYQLTNDVFPWIGLHPLDSIKAPELLALLRKIEARGSIATAHRVRSLLSDVFRFGIATGRADTNPAADVGAALKSIIKGHHPAITDPQRLGQMLRSIAEYGGHVTRANIVFSALTFQRPNEINDATWSEIDLDAATWTIPAQRMKGNLDRKTHGPDHVVPLSRQAVAVLRDLHTLTGHGSKVFPNERGEGASINAGTPRIALRRMGFGDHVPHGFRATARTLIREHLHYPNEAIERQLAHGSDEVLGGAYDRTQFMAQRAKMMQEWADYLDKLRVGADVISLRMSA